MVITCEECDTRFQLDDSRVPDSGVRVRCSRCKHAFFVKPSAEAGDDPVERMASQALAQDAADHPVERGEGSKAAESARDAEADWEFNHEPGSSHDTAFAQAQGVVDELLSVGAAVDAEAAAKADFFGSVDDIDEDIDALLGPAAGSAGRDEGESPLDLASEAPAAEPAQGAAVDAAEAPEPTAAEADPGQLDAVVAEESGDPLAGFGDEDSGDPLASLGDEDSGDPLASLGDEELGSPDEWDFFADDASGAAAAGSARAELGEDAAGTSGRFDDVLAPAPEELPVIEREPSAMGVWVSRAVAAVGWAATFSLGATVLALGLEPRVAPRLPGVASGAGLELVDVQARSLDNAAGGAITLIEGTFRAPSGAARGPGARFAVNLVDADGVAIVADAATLGPAKTSALLRESTPESLREMLAREAKVAAWQPVAPGRAWPFHAVLVDVPAQAASFEIVAIPVAAPPSSAPAAPAPEAEGEEAELPDKAAAGPPSGAES